MAKKRKIVGIIGLNGNITDLTNNDQNNVTNKKNKRDVVGSVSIDGTITKFNETSKSHAQQYNLDGTRKLPTSVSITNNNILNEGAKNKLKEVGKDNLSKAIQQGQINNEKIDLSGKSYLKDTGKTYGDYYYENYAENKDKKIYLNTKDGKYYLDNDGKYEVLGTGLTKKETVMTTPEIEQKKLEDAKKLGYKESNSVQEMNKYLSKISEQTGYSERELIKMVDDYNNNNWDKNSLDYKKKDSALTMAGYGIGTISNKVNKYREENSQDIQTRITNDLIPKDNKKWYQKILKGSEAFADGYDFGDVTKTVGATIGDLVANAGEGFLNSVEGVSDALQYGIADVLNAVNLKDASKAVRNNAKFNSTAAIMGKNEKKEDNFVKGWADDLNKNSISGDFLDTIGQGIGNIGALAGSAYLTGGTAGSTFMTSFTSAYGNAKSTAYQNGANDKTATETAIISGFAEAISEQMFDGIPGMKSAGWGEKLVGNVGSATERYFGSKTGKFVMSLLDSSGEGFEEIVSNVLTATGNDIVHSIDKNYNYGMENQTGNILQDIGTAALSEESLEAFISASITSALVNGGNTIISTSQKNQIIELYAQDQNLTFDQAKEVLNQEIKLRAEKIDTNNLKEQTQVEQNVQNQIANEIKNGTYKADSRINVPIATNTNINENSSSKLTKNEIKAIAEEVNNQQNNNLEQTVEMHTNNELSVPNNKLSMFKKIYKNAFDENGNLRPFKDQLRDFFNKKTYIGEKLIVLPNNKAIEYANVRNVPLEITQHAINSHRDKVSKNVIENLPQELEDSVMAMDSISRPELNARVIILDKYDDTGNPIIATIHQKDGKVAVEINKLSSIYEKSDIQDFINDTVEKGGKIYTNEKTNEWLSFSGLQLPEEVSNKSLVSISNDTTNSTKSQIAPSSVNNMQQNTQNDTQNSHKIPISDEYKQKNTIEEKIEKSNYDNVITYEVPEKITRKQVRQQLLEEMDLTAEELSIGDDIGSINFQITDPIRVNEKVFGRELGEKINRATIEKTKHNEALKTKWLNQERETIKELGIKARSKESAAVQKYSEKQYVNKYGETVRYGDRELMSEFPDIKTQEKIKRASEVLRNKYDSYLEQINEVLTALGYDAIPKRADYMRHFQELGDMFSRTGVPFNLNDMKAEDLPTDINGLTEFNKPGKNWFASSQKRYGEKTTYDAITGIDGYLMGASNLIYHTADIQRYRALSTLIRDSFGQTKGYENLEKLTKEQAKKRIKDIQSNKFSKYAAWLDEQANSLAGKKGTIDRGVERFMGRRAYTALNTIKKQVGSNMTGFNIRSALTNFISSTIASAKINKIAFAKGTIATINNMFKNDGFIEKSDFLTSRFGSKSLSPTFWQKASNAGQIFMSGSDYLTSNIIVRSKYFEGLHKGMSESEAIRYADDFGARVMGDRSMGATAEIFNSKTLGILTQFQLETNNQWQYMIHDTKMDFERNAQISGGLKAGATVLFQLGQLATLSYFFNEFFQTLAGSRAAFDPIDILKKLFGWGDDDDKTFEERLKEAGSELSDSIPFTSLFGSGGRMPISEAIAPLNTAYDYITGNTNSYGGEITLEDFGKDVVKTIPYYLLPTGYSQLKKAKKGLSMFSKDKEIKGSYTESGNLRFPVEDNFLNRLQAALFGEYSSKQAREYFDEGRSALRENQQDIYQALNMPISDYWKTNKKINELKEELKGKSTEERKMKIFNYIDSLDLKEEQKEILKKLQYKSYDDFDDEIKKYINSLDVSKDTKSNLLELLKLD